MTLSPSEDRRTEGVDGPAYELNVICAVPGCDTGRTLQRHHIWRKSDVIGDKWWVKTKDGLLHGNCVNLCGFHHREITDNVSRIVYLDGVFWWKDVLFEPMPLIWQPPFKEISEDEIVKPLRDPEEAKAFVINPISDSEIPEKEKDDDADMKLVERLGVAHVLAPGHDADVCPTCLRKLPRPKDESKLEAKKVRKTWSVAVPLDRWEDGADVIDTLLDEAQKELARNGLPYGEGKTVKYYILTTALGLFVTHAESLMSDG